MNNNVDIKTLMQMTIGDIRELEDGQKIIHDVIEKQKESVKSCIEQQKIDEDWADKFLESLK